MNQTELSLARARADRLYPTSGAFAGAYMKGVRAALAGRTVDACPYRSRRGWLAWRRAWMSGFASCAPSDDE